MRGQRSLFAGGAAGKHPGTAFLSRAAPDEERHAIALRRKRCQWLFALTVQNVKGHRTSCPSGWLVLRRDGPGPSPATGAETPSRRSFMLHRCEQIMACYSRESLQANQPTWCRGANRRACLSLAPPILQQPVLIARDFRPDGHSWALKTIDALHSISRQLKSRKRAMFRLCVAAEAPSLVLCAPENRGKPPQSLMPQGHQHVD